MTAWLPSPQSDLPFSPVTDPQLPSRAQAPGTAHRLHPVTRGAAARTRFSKTRRGVHRRGRLGRRPRRLRCHHARVPVQPGAATPATTRRSGPGRSDQHSADLDPRDPAALLNNPHPPDIQDLGNAGGQAAHARPASAVNAPNGRRRPDGQDERESGLSACGGESPPQALSASWAESVREVGGTHCATRSATDRGGGQPRLGRVLKGSVLRLIKGKMGCTVHLQVDLLPR